MSAWEMGPWEKAESVPHPGDSQQGDGDHTATASNCALLSASRVSLEADSPPGSPCKGRPESRPPGGLEKGTRHAWPSHLQGICDAALETQCTPRSWRRSLTHLQIPLQSQAFSKAPGKGETVRMKSEGCCQRGQADGAAKGVGDNRWAWSSARAPRCWGHTKGDAPPRPPAPPPSSATQTRGHK